MTDDTRLSKEIAEQAQKIEGLREAHLNLAHTMLLADSGRMFPLDLLALAVIKRSMSLCSGFSNLLLSQNYMCAASLVRLQLDSSLRFFAAFIVEDPHDFAHRVLRGEHIRNQKDRTGAKLTDRYLVDCLGKKNEWIARVYRSTSGFIHLSETHIFSTFKSSDSPDSLEIELSESDNFPLELWLELSDCFLACTDGLFEYLNGWVLTKSNPELAAHARRQRASKHEDGLD